MKVVIVCCLHGTEHYGLDVAKKLSSKIPYLLGNRKAFDKKVRFIDSDLNRCFPGNKNGNYEERIAFQLTKKLKSFDYVIDLHSSSNYCPLFGIITKPNDKKINFAKKLGLKMLVIMPKCFASGKALVDFAKCGISLEIGPHDFKDNQEKVLEKINNFLNNENESNKIEIYKVIKVIKKEAREVKIKNFDEVKKGQLIASDKKSKQFSKYDFTAVLVNEEAYENILCLACRKLKA